MALCLFSGCYGHAGDLLKVISEQPVTVETQKDLDQLAQLIDSSMFTCKNFIICFTFTALSFVRCGITPYSIISNVVLVVGKGLADHDEEFGVVYAAVSVNVCFFDHGLHLFLGQGLAHIGHDVLELSGRNQSIAVFIKYLGFGYSS